MNTEQVNPSQRISKQKPSTLFLVLLNALIVFALCTVSKNVIGLIMGMFVFISLVVPTAVIQIIIHFVIRKRLLSPLVRSALFLLPSICLVAFSVVAPTLPQKANHTQPSRSPNGKYVLTMPIENDFWRLTIADNKGNILYKDDSEFIGNLNVYWIWDSEDKVWLYNSDDGRVYFWQNIEGKWERLKWGYSRTKEIDQEIKPPEKLYPHYELESK